MGSSQSTTPSPYADSAKQAAATDQAFSKSSSSPNDTTISFHEDKTKESELSGMPLVHYKCRHRKKKYDNCSEKWYKTEFITGKSLQQDSVCGDLFENYRTCILKGIKVEIWDKNGLPPPLEGSPLAEIEEEDDRS